MAEIMKFTITFNTVTTVNHAFTQLWQVIFLISEVEVKKVIV